MVKVQVKEGILEGEVIENDFGEPFYSFKGIPYAEPPVGHFRFKAPQPKKSWQGVRSATEFGSVCTQVDPASGNVKGSEDCLFLNVYTPDMNPEKALPVMVYIHGGSFTSGSGNDDVYGPEFLVRQGVILVTFNYRLEALGFLSLDTEQIPGNAGMKDQVAALRWVKANIENFGGDADNITLFGESAGGCCASFHLVSPMSKGLFKRAIIQSASLACYWSVTFEPRERALKLAKQLGCNSEDDQDLAEFFLKVDVEKLAGLKLPIMLSTKSYEVSFTITEEKQFGSNERFFFGDPIEILSKGIHKDVKVITGYNQHEGLMAFASEHNLETLQRQANEFKEFFVPKRIQLQCPMKDQLKVGRKIKEFYFKKEMVSDENFDELIAFLSFEMFVYDCLFFTKLISEKSDVYLYKFTCKTERNLFAEFFGLSDVLGDKEVVCHADDLFYLFPVKFSRAVVDKDSELFTHIDRVTTLWTNFAKFGEPTPDESLGVKWTPYTLDQESYLDIGNQLTARNAPDAEEDQFWNSIFKEYLPAYASSGI